MPRVKVKLADGQEVIGEEIAELPDAPAALLNAVVDATPETVHSLPAVEAGPRGPVAPEPDPAQYTLADDRARLEAWKQVAHAYARGQKYADRDGEHNAIYAADLEYIRRFNAVNIAHGLVPASTGR